MTGTKARFPYFKFYPRDWLEATRSMSLEQRGAYIDLICILMEMEGHLRDDDRWISHQMHISTRKWKAVKTDLIEHKKIRISDGLIIQERCLKELDSLLAQSRTRAESATNRERTKRENRENINEFNDAGGTVVPLRARDSDSDSDKERKIPPLSPPAGGARQGSMFAEQPKAALPAKEEKPARRGRGDRTLLPEDWSLPEEWRAEATEKFGATDYQLDRQAASFKRWWLSPDAKDRLKADWRGTWMNWVDRAQQRGQLGQPYASGQDRRGSPPPYRRSVIVRGEELFT